MNQNGRAHIKQLKLPKNYKNQITISTGILSLILLKEDSNPIDICHFLATFCEMKQNYEYTFQQFRQNRVLIKRLKQSTKKFLYTASRCLRHIHPSKNVINYYINLTLLRTCDITFGATIIKTDIYQ